MLTKQFYTLREIIQPSGLFPLSRSTWLRGVKKGIFPAPIKSHLFGNKSIWTKDDLTKIYAAIESDLSQSGVGND
jgi:hypothetical protein